MSVRAAGVEERGRRILAATRALFVEMPFEEITLEAVAARAGVTLQTVLRRFGSKSRLVAAAAEEGTAEVEAHRGQAPVGNAPAAVKNLFDHYEKWGGVALRLLAQEERFEEIARIAQRGRELHATWVARVFAPELARCGERIRAVRRAQLIAVCDVYLWKILRRDLGLSRAEAERAVLGVVEALGAAGGP
ncbi:MAG TPA: helix-turn-helix domain-containing protein [Myxococcaceae bacterium]|nr:helix-turn-helix domain-containing protein [Myxococcaceae bacterium]